jgi:hypothetical protein
MTDDTFIWKVPRSHLDTLFSALGCAIEHTNARWLDAEFVRYREQLADLCEQLADAADRQ